MSRSKFYPLPRDKTTADLPRSRNSLFQEKLFQLYFVVAVAQAHKVTRCSPPRLPRLSQLLRRYRSTLMLLYFRIFWNLPVINVDLVAINTNMKVFLLVNN